MTIGNRFNPRILQRQCRIVSSTSVPPLSILLLKVIAQFYILIGHHPWSSLAAGAIFLVMCDPPMNEL